MAVRLDCETPRPALILGHRCFIRYCQNLSQGGAEDRAEVVEAVVAIVELTAQSGPRDESAIAGGQSLSQTTAVDGRHQRVVLDGL